LATAALRTAPTPTIVPVELGDRSYEIMIGPGLLGSVGRIMADRFPRARASIVTDSNVRAHHMAALAASLDVAGVKHDAIEVTPGEGSKSYGTLQKVVDAILAGRFERGDLVLAFGGGVVGDLAGFAASIARRGMRFIQIPTTLLAQVDSSVGGKTGINSAHGKNLVGAFHQPSLVIADTEILDTLPKREFLAGYAEIAKYGLINDAGFFAWLEKNWPQVMVGGGAEREHAIATSCRAKAAIVAADEFETGDRALLNLGHTFGHALEAATGYSDRLIHGEGVSIGMVLAHAFSAREGLCPPADATRVEAHLKAVGLPTRIDQIPGPRLGVETLLTHIAQDKKVSRGSLTFILTRGIGKAYIARDVSPGSVRTFLTETLGG
jgi:3-dehydroquinate synthase